MGFPIEFVIGVTDTSIILVFMAVTALVTRWWVRRNLFPLMPEKARERVIHYRQKAAYYKRLYVQADRDRDELRQGLMMAEGTLESTVTSLRRYIPPKTEEVENG